MVNTRIFGTILANFTLYLYLIRNYYCITTMRNLFFLIILCLASFSCETKTTDDTITKWKQEIRDTELQFAKMVQEEGIHNAFVAFAADDAVVMRNNSVFKGKSVIDSLYKNANSKTLTWSPDFIEVSISGDLGYTYGTYQYTHKDSTGIETVDTGIFHTVWKRQLDGSWKFVWD